jgi:hypothetical protein
MPDILLEVLDQDQTWTDVHGTVHQISDMEPRYCRNVAAFLRRRADEIGEVRMWTMTCISLPDECSQAYLSVTDDIDREMARITSDPVSWLNQQPLLVALERRGNETV